MNLRICLHMTSVIYYCNFHFLRHMTMSHPRLSGLACFGLTIHFHGFWKIDPANLSSCMAIGIMFSFCAHAQLFEQSSCDWLWVCMWLEEGWEFVEWHRKSMETTKTADADKYNCEQTENNEIKLLQQVLCGFFFPLSLSSHSPVCTCVRFLYQFISDI